MRIAGVLNIVITNLPDVAAGKQSLDVVAEVHRILLQKIPLNSIKVCFHVDAGNCDCGKPRPGMLLASAQEFSIDLGKSFLAGDRWRDIAAGDSYNDTAMLMEADVGYLFRAPDNVKSEFPQFKAVETHAELLGVVREAL